ncbi:MAG TPA: hypothetical protein VF950_27070 [Planctomycetota bacterium]
MSDIISAKCFGCGHIVKVPSALGGKKARCPKCTNTIVIPALAETSDEIVTDDQLPEVARDGEVLEGELVDPEPEPEPAAPESRRDRVSSGAYRRVPPKDSSNRSGTRMPGQRGAPPKKAAKGNGAVIGVVVAVLVVGGIAAGLALRPAKTEPPVKTKRDATTDDPKKDPGTRTAADDALEARCREYISAFNRGQVAQAALFYDPAPNREVQQAVARLMSDSPQYKSAEFKRTSAAEGLTVFVCEYVAGGAAAQGKEVTLRWKQVGDDWFIADRP